MGSTPPLLLWYGFGYIRLHLPQGPIVGVDFLVIGHNFVLKIG